MHSRPHAIVIADPNGAGKSTVAPVLLRNFLGITHFVNADVIAQGLSGFDPQATALRAGHVMWNRLLELSEFQENFAFETTLASRTFAPWLKKLQENRNYRIFLLFLWLPNPELAIARVDSRVEQGGHDIPHDVIRRRYYRGIWNFKHLYQPIVDSWVIFDNSSPVKDPNLVAFGVSDGMIEVEDKIIWNRIQEITND